jgi:hypothetical protein
MSDHSHNDSTVYDSRDAHAQMKKLLDAGNKSMAQDNFDKPVKFLGMEIDAGLAGYATAAYNIGSKYVTNIVNKHVYDLTLKSAEKTPMSRSAALKTAALTTTAVNVMVKSGAFITPMISAIGQHRDAKVQLARRLAPVLDEETGKHSLGALHKVAKNNTIIQAHLKRMDMQNSAENWNNLVDLAVNATPNLALDYKLGKAMWKEGISPAEHKARMNVAAKQIAATAKEHDVTMGGEVKQMGEMLMLGGTGAISDRIKKSNEHKLKKALRPYSALEMILTLDEQMDGNPKARSFQVPGRKGESYNLEEYIARVAIHHFAEMADISSDHSEIRQALHDELMAAAKPIAEAMRKGDLSPMDLVQLIGEEKLVQKGGRVIASPEEIRELIGAEHEMGLNRPHQSPKEHYTLASYNRDELKRAIHSLEGEEKRVFCAWFSNEVLEDAGMKPAEIKAMRDATAKAHDADTNMAASVLGVAAEGAEGMRAEGGASAKEVAALDKASREISHKGAEALHSLQSSANNPNGIEQAVANVAVTKILGDKAYFGTMLDRGKELLAANEGAGKEQASSHGHVANDDERTGFRDRVGGQRSFSDRMHAANDDASTTHYRA